MRVSNLGYPRLGRNRELKTELESFFAGRKTAEELLVAGKTLCVERWNRQKELGVDTLPLNDFSFYDHVLDMSMLLGIIPKRFNPTSPWLELSLEMARGTEVARPLLARSWFNTNYHYQIPEIAPAHFVSPRWEKLRFETQAAAELKDVRFHPVLIGPWTFLKLSSIEGMTFSEALDRLLPRYVELLKELVSQGFEYIQMDEPSLCHDMVREDLRSVRKIYEVLSDFPILLATYFGSPEPWLSEVSNLPCRGFHFDLLYWTTTSAWLKTRAFPRSRELSLGIVSGRNVWATPLWDRKEELQGLLELYGPDRITLAPTCSLLHLPLDKAQEKHWDPEFASWVSFADQRLEELAFLKRALSGDKNVETLLKQRQAALSGRSVSSRVHRPEVKQAVARVEAKQSARGGAPPVPRSPRTDPELGLPIFPTTTVGAFPQSSDARKLRHEWKKKKITDEQYKKAMGDEIERVIRLQEKIGLDVLVHGEVERGDMIEFFAEHWDGVSLTSQGWVQALGSRCVRPPLIFGDVRRRSPATVSWQTFAQGLTPKPVKALLTGPVTILNRSFVREDQGRQKTAYQIALALRDEVLDLEKIGTRIIQIDESALPEGLPMMKVHWNQYLRWAVEAFHVVSSSVGPKTQIHLHLCHSDFSDLAEILCQMGGDVLLVDTARAGGELLKRLKKNRFAPGIAPGVFDVHSSQLPKDEQCLKQLEDAAKAFSARQIWVSPDCGLKGVSSANVEQALTTLVAVAKTLRARS